MGVSLAALFSSLGIPKVNCVVPLLCCTLPNLNPFKGDAVSVLGGPSVLSTPNLNPPLLGGTPNLNCKVDPMLDAGSFGFVVPGFEAWQATHSVCFASFCSKQESQVHAPSGFLNLSPNPLVVNVCSGLLELLTEPGFAVLQQGQVLTELLFLRRHPGHSQESLLGLNLFIMSELPGSVSVPSVLTGVNF